MSVFKSLAEEHAVLLRLVDRLERAAAGPDAGSVEKDAGRLLRALLKALEAHEALEHLIFGEESAPRSGPERAGLALVERERFALAALCEEAAEPPQGLPRENAAIIRDLVRRLARQLRRHFEDEERALWPNFNASAGRSRLHRLDLQARAQVKTMKKELDADMTAVEEHPA